MFKGLYVCFVFHSVGIFIKKNKKNIKIIQLFNIKIKPMKKAIPESVQRCLDSFYYSRKIPHIIFHGPSGSGKRTIVEGFLSQIYGGDKAKMKSNIMWVNCAHGRGRGIKFIREDLIFFAKSNIQFNCGVVFKTIVLLNADSLTTDAQSALRRCIELFSFNTRFFIIVENKDKLLNPILSRFCEVYVPEVRTNGNTLNLHQYTIENAFHLEEHKSSQSNLLSDLMKNISSMGHKEMIDLVACLYENGFSCLDLVEWFKRLSDMDPKLVSSIVLGFHKIRGEYRCEKLLMLYLLDYAFLRKNKDLKNIGFM
jgi:hypothetical protein